MTDAPGSQLFDLADAHFRAGRFAEAGEACRTIVQAQPDFHPAWRLWGLAAYSLGDVAAAAEHVKRALELAPQAAEYHDNLGIVRAAQGRFEEAEYAAQRALQLMPALHPAANNLGAALKAQGRLEEAEVALRHALAIAPDYVPALNNLGAVLAERGRAEEGEALCRRAVQLEPGYADARVNLGLALQRQRRLAEAEACYRQAIGQDPAQPLAHDNLGTALLAQGRVHEARQEHLRALAIRPGFSAAHSHALMCLHYMAEAAEPDLARAHAEWDRAHAARWAASAPAVPLDRDPDRPLRLGFVSPDFGEHPVGRFLVRVLENLDRRECEIVCYSDRFGADRITERIRAASQSWCDSSALNDDALATRIRNDRVDVLFDLAGHTARNRLLVFARKPAPLQVSWIGYPGSTGLSAIDCLVADSHQVPDASLAYYRERVLRLPGGSVCYDPPAALDVGPLPALGAGRVTYGSFSNPAKINKTVIAVWSDILRQTPGSRLVVKYNGFDDPPTRQRYLREFEQAGLEEGRVELLGYSPPDQMAAEYRRIDIGLDPFPYSGGLTTCEALWMGVPVVTCPGRTFAGRHAAAHVRVAGLDELVAADLGQYVKKAVELAADWNRLAALRARLRAQVAASPLCDGGRLSASLLAALRGVWREKIHEAANPGLPSKD